MKYRGRLVTVTCVLGVIAVACTAPDGGDPEAADQLDAPPIEAAVGGADVVVTDNLLDEIKDRGELIVGMSLQFEPQMYRDDDDQPAGFDVELLNMLADDLEVELTIMDQEFDSLIPGLLAGQVDMVSTGLVGLPARLEQLWFTCPYVAYRQVALTHENSGLTSADDMNDPDVRITALIGSTSANLVESRFPDAELVELEQQPAFLEVASERADAIVVEEWQASRFVEEHPNTFILNPDDPFDQLFGAWAIPRGEIVWQQYLNGWLRHHIGRGTVDDLYAEVVGPTGGLPFC